MPLPSCDNTEVLGCFWAARNFGDFALLSVADFRGDFMRAAATTAAAAAASAEDFRGFLLCFVGDFSADDANDGRRIAMAF